MDSKPILPIILSGQNNLLDKLMYYTSRPLASLVVARSRLEGLKSKDMAGYLKTTSRSQASQTHSLPMKLCWPSIRAQEVCSDELITSPEVLIAAANKKCRVVSAEHVRIASTEII